MRTEFYSTLAMLSLIGLSGPAIADAGSPGCNDIVWKPEVVARFPDVERGCQEIIVRDGRLFARFEARLINARVTNGMVKIKILLPGGGEVERTFHAPRNFRVTTTGGGEYRIFELDRGEILDIYISDNSFSLAADDKAADYGAGLPI